MYYDHDYISSSKLEIEQSRGKTTKSESWFYSGDIFTRHDDVMFKDKLYSLYMGGRQEQSVFHIELILRFSFE